MNSILKIITVSFIAAICGLWTVDCGLVFAAKLTVPEDVTTDALILDPQGSSPATANEGQIYYDDTVNKLKYYDGAWKELGGGGGADTAVATKVVAASNTPNGSQRADTGYVCDGTADQVEIQNAIDALGTTGGVVYLLEGTYNISGSINLNTTAPNDSGKAIIGTGAGTVLNLIAGTANYIFFASGVNRILISQLMCTKTGIYNCQWAIYFTSVTYSKIDKVWVKNMRQTSSGGGIYLETSSYNTLYGNVLDTNDYGIRLITSSAYNTVSGNTVIQGYYGSGISLVNSSINNTVSGNTIQGSGTGISISNANINTISGNNVYSSGSCMDVTTASFNAISGNSLTGAGQGPDADGYGIILQTSSNNNAISGNTIQENGAPGIRVYSSSNNIILGNKLHKNGYTNGTACSISIETNSANNLISSNDITDTGGTGYAIRVYAGGSNNYLTGNRYSGSGANASSILIQDTSNPVQYTDKVKLTFEPGSGYTGLAEGGTLTPSGPSSYLRLNPAASLTLSATTAVADGKSSGDLLILENTNSSYTVTLNDNANVQLYQNGPRALGQNDVLTLIWDKEITDWIEIGYADN